MHPYDSVVLITGASRGVGAAAAEAFDRAGAKVALAGADRAGLERVAAHLKNPLVIPTDFSKVEECEAMVRRTVEHFGRLDILINNAAANRALSSDRVEAKDVHEAMEQNFIGPMAATRRAVSAMRRQGKGQIVNVSAAGYLLGMPLMAPYAASKAAFSSWTRAMQAEWAGTEIAVTEFFIGFVEPESGDDGDRTAEPALKDVAGSPWAGLLFRAQSPDEVARKIVDAVKAERSTDYSSASVRMMAFLGLFARLRVSLASGVARTLRFRTGSPVFTTATADSDVPSTSAPVATPAASPAAESAEAPKLIAAPEVKSLEAPKPTTAPATKPAEEPKPAPVAKPEQEAKPAPAPVAKPAQEPKPASVTAAKPAAARAARKTTAKKTAKKVATKRSTAKKATKKATAKKTTAKKTTKAAAKKVAALSPEATARVRAAAERAAASAKGEGAAKTKSSKESAASSSTSESSEKKPSGS